PQPSTSTLFPYTTLFRSPWDRGSSEGRRAAGDHPVPDRPGGGDHRRAVLGLLGHGGRGYPRQGEGAGGGVAVRPCPRSPRTALRDRKSTRLNSSHRTISY